MNEEWCPIFSNVPILFKKRHLRYLQLTEYPVYFETSPNFPIKIKIQLKIFFPQTGLVTVALFNKKSHINLILLYFLISKRFTTF